MAAHYERLQHNREDSDNLPLKGIRVIDLSWIVAGPQATRILADFGAEVIRVEYEGRLDSIRLGMSDPNLPPSYNTSGFFNNLNRNKLSVTLNLNHPRGIEVFKRLVTISDIVLENYSSRVMEEWGLAYDDLVQLNPRVIYVSICGFGHTGRDRDYSTWGPTAQAISGLTLMSGLPDVQPAGWGYSYLDHTAGYYGAIAIMMALHYRNVTGQGQYIDISQVETGMVLTGPAVLDYTVNGRRYRRPGNPPGNRSQHPRVAPHNTYRCRGEDRWIAIAVFNDDEWQALCRAMGEPEWCRDQRFATNSGRVAHEDELDRNIEQWTATFTPHDLMYLLQAAGVPAGAVQNIADRMEHDPQLKHRGFYPEADHPELGRHRFEGVPAQMSRSRWSIRQGGPCLGADNDYVYKQLLGMSDEEVIELMAEAVI